MNPTEIHSVQPSLCMIHTKRLAQKEKPDYGDSGHSQIWIFSIFSGMGLDVLGIGVVGGSAGWGEINPSAPALPAVLTLLWGGSIILCLGHGLEIPVCVAAVASSLIPVGFDVPALQ
jgi:hypothetical protein